ncbi:hypothetical protein SCHPADRAFT_907731 [Schizopora paradoxa]|uniref:COP9 signalosome complex subunit 3 n=1 Tax=Schizopora paradoxa TaxID=27342 RepID=A0A0H2RD73_9AGAM|nr:hypothetical protein SCHPADRAFT_907731 [Schizopora paradoxa]
MANQAQPENQQQLPTSLDGIVALITSSTSPVALAEQLREFSKNRDGEQELILASSLPGGQEPLEILDVKNHTVGWAFILSARLAAIASKTIETGVPPLQALSHFCENHDPEQAALVPDRMTLFARSLVEYVELSNEHELPACVPLLLTLLNRSQGGLATLSPIHALFARLCVRTRNFDVSLPVLRTPITAFSPTHIPSQSQSQSTASSSSLAGAMVSQPSSERSTAKSHSQKGAGSELLLNYTDHLVYHYAGGLTFAVLNHWAEAEEFFEIVVTAPIQSVPSAIQLEAMKKLALVQLILYGKTKELPKYTSSALPRLFRNSPYAALVNAFPLQRRELRATLDKERSVFEQDKNLGLVNLVLTFAPRWCLQKLTATYSTLSLKEIVEHVGLTDGTAGTAIEQARELASSMIANGEIAAELDAEGFVHFADVDPAHVISKEKVERLLRGAQSHASMLADLDREVLRSKEFLGKALKNRDDGWGASEDDMMFGGMAEMKGRGHGMDWAEENLFE